MTLTLADMAPLMERTFRALYGDKKYEAAMAEVDAEAKTRADMKVRLDALEEFLLAGDHQDHFVTVAVTRALYATP